MFVLTTSKDLNWLLWLLLEKELWWCFLNW